MRSPTTTPGCSGCTSGRRRPDATSCRCVRPTAPARCRPRRAAPRRPTERPVITRGTVTGRVITEESSSPPRPCSPCSRLPGSRSGSLAVPPNSRARRQSKPRDGSTPRPSPRLMSTGKVVLYDFWTYSCINCVHTLPYVKAWYARYAADGLVVLSIHTPEFEFEADPRNVANFVAGERHQIPGGARSASRHVARVGQPLLARVLCVRPHWRPPLPALRRGQVRRDRGRAALAARSRPFLPACSCRHRVTRAHSVPPTKEKTR